MRLASLCILLFFFIPGVNGQQKLSHSTQIISDSIEDDWSFEANAFYYIIPNEKNTSTLIGYADHYALHLEARYNYEDEETFSLFGGYNFETGKDLVLGLTPMIGFAAGNTKAIIPGLEINLKWKVLDLYSESEIVFDLEGKENNYFYIWTELGITPFENFRTGISITRTILFQSDFDFQRGAFIEYSFGKFKTMIYYFNPFSDNAYLMPSIGIEF